MLDNPCNRLSDGLDYMLDLVNRVKIEDRMIDEEEEWRQDKVRAYLERKRGFLERLMLAMYLTGGQPARGTELGSIKYCNTGLSSRNIFIYKGVVCYTTEYVKPRSTTGLSHYIVRFLPKDVGEMVLIYLAFIRPFTNFLYSQIDGGRNVSDGSYLFSTDGKPEDCWDGKELKKVLSKESERIMNARLDIWGYRHVVIGITKRHIKKLSIYFGEQDRQEVEKFISEKICDIYAWQAGHSWQTNTQTYGLDTAYPNRLQPGLLNEYLQASSTWHEWIGFEVESRETIVEVGEKEQGSTLEAIPELSPVSSQCTAIVLPMTPRKRKEREAEEVEECTLSPESKRLNDKIKNLRRQMQLRRELKRLNEEEDI